MTLSDDLNATADEIERRGWTKGSYYIPETGRVCLVGGIEHMLNIYQDQIDEYESDEASKRINRSISVRSAIKNFLDLDTSIEAWNDEEVESQEQVVQMLRDAATKNQPDTMWGRAIEAPGGGGGG